MMKLLGRLVGHLPQGKLRTRMVVAHAVRAHVLVPAVFGGRGRLLAAAPPVAVVAATPGDAGPGAPERGGQAAQDALVLDDLGEGGDAEDEEDARHLARGPEGDGGDGVGHVLGAGVVERDDHAGDGRGTATVVR